MPQTASPLIDILAAAGASPAELPAGHPFPMPAHFDRPEQELSAARAGRGLCDLSGRRVLRLSGIDVIGWLTGMVSNEVKSLEVGQSRYAFTLNRQGRIVSDLSCVRTGESEFLVELPADRCAAVARHFDRYIIMEDVKVEDISDQFGQLGVFGDPGDVQELRVGPTACAGDFVQLLVPVEKLAALWERLIGQGLQPVGLTTLNALRIEAGVPWCGVDFDESNLPAETGQLARAVSFTKGCYIGQEVVARMQALGAPSKVTMHVNLGGDRAPATPANLRIEGKSIGRLTSAAAFDGRVVGLAMIARQHAINQQAVEVVDESGAVAGTLAALPGLT